MQRGGAGAAQYGRDASQYKQLRTLVVAAALHGVAGSLRARWLVGKLILVVVGGRAPTTPGRRSSRPALAHTRNRTLACLLVSYGPLARLDFRNHWCARVACNSISTVASLIFEPAASTV